MTDPRSPQLAASEDFPHIEVVEGFTLHVYREDEASVPFDTGLWACWLNTEAADFDGIALSSRCATRDEAVGEAVRVLEAAVERLQAGPTVS